MMKNLTGKLTLIVMLLELTATFQSCDQKKKEETKGVEQAQTEKSKVTSLPKIFVVLDITVKDTIMYEQYRIKVEPIIKKYGGEYLVRSGGMAFDKDPDKKVIPGEGNWNPNRLIILEWNSMEELQTFINSTEYQKVAELRKNSASTKSVIVKEHLTD